MNKLFPSLLLISLLFFHCKSEKICDGVLCDDSCNNCYNCKQEINCFINQNCFCASTNIPGGLSLEETPQFVFFTIDDSIDFSQFNVLDGYKFILNNAVIKDARGCTVRPTTYIMQQWTDFNMVTYFSKIGAVGLHTISHTTSAISSQETFYNELSKEKENFRILAEVTDIKGSRAPYLQPNQGYFNVLSKLGLLYDSSMMDGFSSDDPSKRIGYWPFTLDFGVPESRLCNIYDSTSCPTSIHRGLWEVPLVSFTSDSPSSLMDYEILDNDYDIVMAKMKLNFLETYQKNKVPRGFYVHHRYFSNNGDFDSLQVIRAKFANEFFIWLSSHFQDVVFATEDQVINWIKNPQTISQIKADSAWACVNYESSPENACQAGMKECHHYPNDPYDPLIVCGDRCPQPMPDENTVWSFLPVNTDANRWGGEVRIEEDEKWTTGGCFSLYSLHKNTGKIAQSHILTLSIQLNKGYIMEMWGHVQYEFSRGNTVQTFRQKGEWNEQIAFDNRFMGGFCISTEIVYSSTFVSKYVRAGIDFYEEPLKCPLEGCAVFCGDGKCDGMEDVVNCPVDCKSFGIV